MDKKNCFLTNLKKIVKNTTSQYEGKYNKKNPRQQVHIPVTTFSIRWYRRHGSSCSSYIQLSLTSSAVTIEKERLSDI